ncbi:hypothetical protein PX554_09350 [Sphingomonas sp. H39-1-10]|uniref:hypothetical protein n=1 Tax=Sphingomonas pollutisoli TaxID=3030829 RepID=UPI0023B92993|nr:hypothetical protein [Sphingomonas pollutisoli]MDF0488335.1 hypothetical protein [Sphingomonas pollutisoli]
MPNLPVPISAPARQPVHHRARASIGFGRARMRASVSVTSGGIVSVAVLVSSILLSTAVIVHTAGKRARRTRAD